MANANKKGSNSKTSKAKDLKKRSKVQPAESKKPVELTEEQSEDVAGGLMAYGDFYPPS